MKSFVQFLFSSSDAFLPFHLICTCKSPYATHIKELTA